MVEVSTEHVDQLFRALGSAPRREILRQTAAQPRSVTQLAEHFDMSLAAVSKHVQVLAEAGLLSLTREGRVHWCRLQPEALETARATLDELRSFWNKRLDALEHLFEAPTTGRRSRRRS
ncbi:MAG: ArsR/SmtB family transcription factor [Myxococcota bacterium]